MRGECEWREEGIQKGWFVESLDDAGWVSKRKPRVPVKVVGGKKKGGLASLDPTSAFIF